MSQVTTNNVSVDLPLLTCVNWILLWRKRRTSSHACSTSHLVRNLKQNTSPSPMPLRENTRMDKQAIFPRSCYRQNRLSCTTYWTGTVLNKAGYLSRPLAARFLLTPLLRIVLALWFTQFNFFMIHCRFAWALLDNHHAAWRERISFAPNSRSTMGFIRSGGDSDYTMDRWGQQYCWCFDKAQYCYVSDP